MFIDAFGTSTTRFFAIFDEERVIGSILGSTGRRRGRW
jgi:hypothetical protein